MPPHAPFPFTALVGQDEVKDALILAAVNPRVQGVLLIGPKGTGKTTAVRGLADLLPEITHSLCPNGCEPTWALQDPERLCPDCRAKLNRGWGDVFGYMLVASGRAEIMLDPSISIWDIAGVAPIIREAGGYFGNWSGEFTIGGPDSCAINAALSSEVLEVLKNENRR